MMWSVNGLKVACGEQAGRKISQFHAAIYFGEIKNNGLKQESQNFVRN